LKNHLTVRSRNSEFGRVQVRVLDIKNETTPKNLGNELVLWCVSDVQILNEYGMPCLTPQLQDIHPDFNGKLVPERSFIRSQSISRYNQTRQGLDSEQILISKGSVLAYELDAPLNDEQLNSLSHEGIGLNRQQGLGWVYVNPDWATTSNIESDKRLFNTIILPEPSENKASNADGQSAQNTNRNTALLAYLTEQASRHSNLNKAHLDCDTLIADFVKAYQNARTYNNIRPEHAAGPSRTQWGRILQTVKNQGKQWKQTTLEGTNPIISEKNDELGWGISWQDGKTPTTFAAFTKNKLEGLDTQTLLVFLEAIKEDDFSLNKDLKTFEVQQNVGAAQ
jgi:CRISPR-associated protein Csx10